MGSGGRKSIDRSNDTADGMKLPPAPTTREGCVKDSADGMKLPTAPTSVQKHPTELHPRGRLSLILIESAELNLTNYGQGAGPKKIGGHFVPRQAKNAP